MTIDMTHNDIRNTHNKIQATSDERQAASDSIIADQKKAAKYAGVSDRTIRRWVKEKMPLTNKGHYIKHFLDVWKQNDGKPPTEEKNRQQKAEAEYKELKTKLLQIEFDIKTGKLIPLENIQKDRIQKIQMVKRALLGLGRKLAKNLTGLNEPREIQAIIDQEVKGIIEGFAS
jgi:DNA-binding transcriptional MerR regulator